MFMIICLHENLDSNLSFGQFSFKSEAITFWGVLMGLWLLCISVDLKYLYNRWRHLTAQSLMGPTVRPIKECENIQLCVPWRSVNLWSIKECLFDVFQYGVLKLEQSLMGPTVSPIKKCENIKLCVPRRSVNEWSIKECLSHVFQYGVLKPEK